MKNGKGKNLDVVYWICASNRRTGYTVRATTERDNVTNIQGDHNGHPNDSTAIQNRLLKVFVF